MGSFFQILESFFELIKKKKIVALGLCKSGGGGICAEQHTFQLNFTVTNKWLQMTLLL